MSRASTFPWAASTPKLPTFGPPAGGGSMVDLRTRRRTRDEPLVDWSARRTPTIGLRRCGQHSGTLGDGSDTAEITVDTMQHYQTISGWEAHAQSGQDSPDFPRFQDRLFDLAVNDLGINRLRLEAWSGMEADRDFFSDPDPGQRAALSWRCRRFAPINDDADPHHINWAGFQFSRIDSYVERVVLPVQRRLEARGETLFVNLLYDSFMNQCPSGTEYPHANPDEYAEFVLAVSLHLRQKYGLVPDAWELILEPDNTGRWNGEKMGTAMVAAAHALEANGFTPRFIAPSNTSAARSLQAFDRMVAVPGVLSYLSEYSYHRYDNPSEETIRQIAERAERYHVRTSMLEHIGSGYEDLHEDLKVGQVSAWQQMGLAYTTTRDKGGEHYLIDEGATGDAMIRLASRSRYLRQYFRYIRRGAVRVGATSTEERLDPLAFINANGNAVVVVKANAGGEISVTGIPAGRYGIRYTTDNETDTAQPDVELAPGAVLHTAIPAEGVLTLYQL